MSRLTITVSEARCRALKGTATRRGRSTGQLIDESLEFYGIKYRDDVRALVRRAREHAALSEDEAMEVVLEEVERVRRGK